MVALTHISQDAKPIPAPGTSYQVIGTRFRHPLPAQVFVLFEGRRYTINHHLLPALDRGETPLNLELEPDEAEGDE